jgi:hypothetical protein
MVDRVGAGGCPPLFDGNCDQPPSLTPSPRPLGAEREENKILQIEQKFCIIRI